MEGKPNIWRNSHDVQNGGGRGGGHEQEPAGARTRARRKGRRTPREEGTHTPRPEFSRAPGPRMARSRGGPTSGTPRQSRTWRQQRPSTPCQRRGSSKRCQCANKPQLLLLPQTSFPLRKPISSTTRSRDGSRSAALERPLERTVVPTPRL